MKANELRIGNWISDEGDFCQITMIQDGHVNFKFDGLLIHSFPEDIAPISLTEEWLEKFGFYETSRYGKYLEFNINQEQALRLPICKHSEKDFWYVLRGSVKIQYVHQLQNLYFVLTGQELTFKN